MRRTILAFLGLAFVVLSLAPGCAPYGYYGRRGYYGGGGGYGYSRGGYYGTRYSRGGYYGGSSYGYAQPSYGSSYGYGGGPVVYGSGGGYGYSQPSYSSGVVVAPSSPGVVVAPSMSSGRVVVAP